MEQTTTREFVERLFKDLQGFVYAPVKHADGSFDKHWFLWPSEDYGLMEHLADCEDKDVYLSPVMYEAEDTQAFYASNVCWVDFDYGFPSELGDFPQPGFLIASSSSPKKRHAYWVLSGPVHDSGLLARWNKQLAYALGGDTGCWNFNRVLRPPGTFNHKYNPPSPVICTDSHEETIDPFVFAMLPEVKMTEDTDWDQELSKLTIQELNRKYTWRSAAYDFFTSPKYDGERHKALTSVALTCIEMGMQNDEVMVFLLDADTRWKKFTGRSDRMERLKAIVDFADQSVDAEVRDVPKASSEPEKGKQQDKPEDLNRPQPFSKFASHKFDVDWAIEGLIHSRGMGLVVAPPGVGKTQFALNLTMACATGRNFLKWKVPKPKRILFLSLEMSQPELKDYLDTMVSGFSPRERELLDENAYFIYKAAFRLGSEANQAKLLEWIDEVKPDGIIIDSLSRVTGGDLAKEDIDTVFDFLNSEVRDRRECFIFWVHHSRKGNFQQTQPKKLDDVYGSQFIGAYCSTVLGLWKITNTELEVNCLKIWLRPQFRSFFINRPADLIYTCPEGITELK